MNLEIKPVYNDFFNKISDKSDKSENSEYKHNKFCTLDEISSEQEVFTKLNNILNCKKPKKNSDLLSKSNSYVMHVDKSINSNPNLNPNQAQVKTKGNPISNNKTVNTNAQISKQLEKSNSDNYTNSSGLGEDNLILKNIYLQNIKVKTEQNNLYTINRQNQVTNRDLNLVLESGSNFDQVKSKHKKKEKSNSLINTNSSKEDNSPKEDNSSKEDNSKTSEKDPLYDQIKETGSIDEEFKQFFNKDKKKRLDIDSKEKQFNKLEKYYDKVVKKTNEKINKNNIVNKLDNNPDKKYEEIDESKYKKKDLVKIILNKIEKEIYIESTRGYNIEQNIYKINMEKLRLNLSKFNLSNNSKCVVGYLYRNYNNPKVYSTTNENTYWLEVSNNGFMGQIIQNELDSNDKFLNSCLKNFKQTKKFKKQIGSSLVRAHIKTVEILNSNNLIIDIIFFVKCK